MKAPFSIWAWESKHGYNESGFRPNSFTFLKETIDSRTARGQQCLQPLADGVVGIYTECRFARVEKKRKIKGEIRNEQS